MPQKWLERKGCRAEDVEVVRLRALQEEGVVDADEVVRGLFPFSTGSIHILVVRKNIFFFKIYKFLP